MRFSKKGDKQHAPKKEKKLRFRSTKKLREGEIMHAAPPIPMKKGHSLQRPGAWILGSLAKENPNVAKMQDMLKRLPREDLENRIAWIYCTILGLCNMEGQ